MRQKSLKKIAPKGVSEKKYDSCVEQVKAKNSKVNPYAICAAALKRSSCAPDKMLKDDRPHPKNSPEEQSHEVVESGKKIDEAISEVKPQGKSAMVRFLLHYISIKNKPQKWRSPQNVAKSYKKK